MTDRVNWQKAPDHVDRVSDPEYMRMSCTCLDVDGRHYCASGQFSFGIVTDDAGSFATLMLARGNNGLHWQMPAPGVRELGESLLRIADALDAKAAETAAALFAATLGKRKPE